MKDLKKFNMNEKIKSNETILEDEMVKRYLKLYGGTISDVLDNMGYRDQVLPKELKGLKFGDKFCGFALTATGKSTTINNPDEIFIPILEMLGSVEKNSVVITQPNDNSCSHLGELSATTIKARGGVGAVIYGGVRDVDYIHNLGLPVFNLYTTPKDVMGRWLLTDYNIPIQIENVKINPKDIVFADKDGVIIIPRKVAIDVLLKAEELHNTENYVRKDVIAGVHPVEAYKKYGWF